MTTFSEIRLEKNGPVATITLWRAERFNAITTTMGIELKTAFKNVAEDATIRVLVITGNGKYFCTGMDLAAKGDQSLMGEEESDAAAHNAYLIFEPLRKFPKPVIGRINGPVIAGGLGLMFVCDIRVALKGSYLCFSEVKRGLVPALISTYIIPQLGLYHTKQFMLTGERVPIERAYELGAVSGLADDAAQLDKLVQGYINELLQNGPNAMANVKKLSNFVSSHTHEENIDAAKQVFAQMIKSDEAAYGISCFLKREKVDWSPYGLGKL
eukprot:TRINITY_DN95_c0_g1_i2.p1 TRINITY_DN95_c0_g1~~TRINITY_DN95_c0_g1_i2.p1  ORF type:complete len:269 (-),score=69.47 TRINITY_DN95_c0_g1_i2:119-925(-)